jgi:hypothetical protein
LFVVHTPLAQSVAARHALVAGHGEHDPPPQSVSVSVPFFAPSVQLPA